MATVLDTLRLFENGGVWDRVRRFSGNGRIRAAGDRPRRDGTHPVKTRFARPRSVKSAAPGTPFASPRNPAERAAKDGGHIQLSAAPVYEAVQKSEKPRFTEAGRGGITDAAGAGLTASPKRIALSDRVSPVGSSHFSSLSLSANPNAANAAIRNNASKTGMSLTPSRAARQPVIPHTPFRKARYTSPEDICQEQMSFSMPSKGYGPIDYDDIYHYIEQRLSEAVACSAEGV